MNWNVAAYLRLSKEEFYGDKNSNSISNQKQIIDSYIKEKNNLKLKMEIREELSSSPFFTIFI